MAFFLLLIVIACVRAFSPALRGSSRGTTVAPMYSPRLLCAAVLLLAAPSNALVVAGGRVCRPHRSPRSGLLLLSAAATPPLQPPEDVKPPASGLAVPLPRFSWRTVAFIALNPAALLPLPLAGWFLGVNLLGSAFSVSRLVCYLGLLWALPLFALSLLPLERIPALSALREVSQASETICLYALGSRLAPLRASVAAVLLSTSAALCEELAFRGLLQTLAASSLAALGMPARACVALAVAAQAVLFGVLHSYTPSPVYVVAASLAGVCFGAAYASTANLAVPIIMHFAVDFVSFMICHVQARAASPGRPPTPSHASTPSTPCHPLEPSLPRPLARPGGARRRGEAAAAPGGRLPHRAHVPGDVELGAPPRGE